MLRVLSFCIATNKRLDSILKLSLDFSMPAKGHASQLLYITQHGGTLVYNISLNFTFYYARAICERFASQQNH